MEQRAERAEARLGRNHGDRGTGRDTENVWPADGADRRGGGKGILNKEQGMMNIEGVMNNE